MQFRRARGGDSRDPAARILKQVTLDEAADADETFAILMGDLCMTQKENNIPYDQVFQVIEDKFGLISTAGALIAYKMEPFVRDFIVC